MCYGEGGDLLAVAEPVFLRTIVQILHYDDAPTGVHKQTCRNTDMHHVLLSHSNKLQQRLIFSALQKILHNPPHKNVMRWMLDLVGFFKLCCLLHLKFRPRENLHNTQA